MGPYIDLSQAEPLSAYREFGGRHSVLKLPAYVDVTASMGPLCSSLAVSGRITATILSSQYRYQLDSWINGSV